MQEYNFDEIYDSYKDLVFSQVILTLGDRDIAEEVTQDIFVKIYFGLKDFREDSHIKSWIYTITHRSCINYIRKKYKHQSNSLEEIGDIPDDQQDISKQLENREIIEHIFTFLSPQQREIIILKYHLGYKIRDIMKLWGLSENQTKKLLYSSKQQFTTYYQKYYENPST